MITGLYARSVERLVIVELIKDNTHKGVFLGIFLEFLGSEWFLFLVFSNSVIWIRKFHFVSNLTLPNFFLTSIPKWAVHCKIARFLLSVVARFQAQELLKYEKTIMDSLDGYITSVQKSLQKSASTEDTQFTQKVNDARTRSESLLASL